MNPMTKLQDLLNEEALLSNTGQGDSRERAELHTIIRLMRDETRRPHCFGEDDCSTIMLSQCPWRMDCGAEAYHNWGG
jgi:hypothetical protein